MTKVKEFGLMEKIAAFLFVAFYVGVNIYLLNSKPCVGIDQEFLSCKFKLVSFFDWLGLAIFNIAPVYMTYYTFKPTYAKSVGSNPAAAVIITTFLVGLGLISLL